MLLHYVTLFHFFHPPECQSRNIDLLVLELHGLRDTRRILSSVQGVNAVKLTLLESGLIDDCEQGLWKMNHAVQQHVKTLLGKSEHACVESVCAMFRRIMDCFAGRMQLVFVKNRTGTSFAHEKHTGFEDLNIFLHHVTHFIDVVRSHRNHHANLEGRLLTGCSHGNASIRRSRKG